MYSIIFNMLLFSLCLHCQLQYKAINYDCSLLDFLFASLLCCSPLFFLHITNLFMQQQNLIWNISIFRCTGCFIQGLSMQGNIIMQFCTWGLSIWNIRFLLPDFFPLLILMLILFKLFFYKFYFYPSFIIFFSSKFFLVYAFEAFQTFLHCQKDCCIIAVSYFQG